MTGGHFSATMFSYSTFSGDLLILGSGVCWAIYTVLGKPMFTRYKPMTVTITNIVIGTLFLVILALTVENFSIVPGISTSTWVIVLYLAFVCSGLAYILWYESLNHLDASKAGSFLFTIPLFTIMIAHLTIGEAVTRSVVIGAALVILGVYLAERG
jgi:drug/metabolite transporter (DMT)-like permease